MTTASENDKILPAINPHTNNHPDLHSTTASIRILVAEDNDINRRVIQIVLERLGYTADYVVDGIEAVAAATATRYDLILMDMLMPGMNGIEATRSILSAVPSEHQPIIIAMTASARTEDEQECLRAGMKDYISKPFRMETVQEKIALYFPG